MVRISAFRELNGLRHYRQLGNMDDDKMAHKLSGVSINHGKLIPKWG
jgi:hypothetical protein